MFRRRWLYAASALTVVLHFCPCRALAQRPSSQSTTPPNAPKPEWTEIPVQPAEPSAASSPSSIPRIALPDFTSCSIADLRRTVHDLAHLKPAQDQSRLPALLDKIGGRTVEIANKTPNPISREAVITERAGTTEKQEFSFLILQHPFGKDSRVFDEYRVDVATGDKIQTEFVEKAATSSASPSFSDLPAAHTLPAPADPASQGFVSAWLYFYPPNRAQFEFRDLGEQRINGHRTLVVAFAQKPALVLLPTVIGFENRNYPIFMRGVAWVDASDFSILRLRLDPLSVPAALPLRQFTVDIQFAQVSVADQSSLLWVPSQVAVITDLAGSTSRETHHYSNYRLFGSRSKIVPK